MAIKQCYGFVIQYNHKYSVQKHKACKNLEIQN